MDPNACLRLVVDALDAGDDDAARDHAGDLYTWLERQGGFEPDWSACGMTCEAFYAYYHELEEPCDCD